MKEIGKVCKANGITLLYHNHDFEFEKTEDGEYVLDALYSEIGPDLLATEIDTCWVNVGGEVPADYIRKYSGRAPIVHLKDFYGERSENMYELIGIKSEAPKRPNDLSVRMTQCVSTQVGCAMACSFCSTGKLGFKRNMTMGEILGQVQVARRYVNDTRPEHPIIRNLVYMGMGEPLLNFGNVMDSLRTLQHPKGLAFSPRRITVSTCGIEKGMREFGDSGLAFLAVSLHAPNQALREQLMPRAAHWHLDDLISALESYPLKTRERITLEYLVIAGLNDQPEHVKQLARICSRLKAKLNLIPYNPTPGTPYQAPTPEELLRFEKALWAKDITAIVRKSKGQDIEAACGQLRAAHEAKAQEEA
jgi:23S rRNA (adenine2503-C2)-methyltransferase